MGFTIPIDHWLKEPLQDWADSLLNEKKLKKVLIGLNTAWNLINFRAGLIRALMAHGYEVVTVAPPDKYVPLLAELGCRYVPLAMDNKGTHPGRDLMLLWRFWCLLKHEKPDVYLGYTVKPNVYGSIAAHYLKIPVINNIAGLGSVFIVNGWLTRVVKLLYRLALYRSAKVFFQNEDDRQQFVGIGLVRKEVTDRLPGSGVDLSWFSLPLNHVLKNQVDKFRFLLVARMLWDKGVGEYVDAARRVRLRWPQAEFCLLGFLDVQNPAAISQSQMDDWVKEGVVKYLGVSDDVRAEVSSADCMVLPSYYREGVPRSLLEAAAMGRPIITTDSIGCREVVDDGINGYLCKVRDSVDLSKKMMKILELSNEKCAEMGRCGREKMEQEFDERIVVDKYITAIDKILAASTNKNG